MALIKCPDCGNDVSDKAKVCINCGCPLEMEKANGHVKIKLPQADTIFFTSAKISDSSGNILWRGKLGQIAELDLSKTTTIVIDCGSLNEPLKAEIDPRGNPRFSLALQPGMHWKGHYMLNRVDVIDSE